MKAETRRTLIRLTLTIAERWAVGGVPRSDAGADLPVLVDPRTELATSPRPYLPATGLVGSLRQHLPGEMAIEWLGPEPSDHEVTTGTLSDVPSERLGRLQILGTRPIDGMVQQRGTTRVDGGRGAAARTSLRTEEWAEPALAVALALHEGPADDDLLTYLSQWRPILGRARSTGLGRASVTSVDSVTIDLATADHLEWWLFHRDGWLRGDAAAPASADARTREGGASPSEEPAFAVTFTTTERVHVGVSDVAEGEQRNKKQPTLRSRRTAALPQGHLTVPGSTWKGLYRHRCATILRLVGASEADIESVIAGLFGADTRTTATGRAGRGLLSFSDTIAPAATEMVRRHVAIDRFTGGARDGALFALLAIPEDQALELKVHAPQPLPTAVVTLLLHVTRDLHEGLIGVGGHQTRGYGSVVADASTVSRFSGVGPVDVADLVAALPQPEPVQGDS